MNMKSEICLQFSLAGFFSWLMRKKYMEYFYDFFPVKSHTNKDISICSTVNAQKEAEYRKMRCKLLELHLTGLPYRASPLTLKSFLLLKSYKSKYLPFPQEKQQDQNVSWVTFTKTLWLVQRQFQR